MSLDVILLLIGAELTCLAAIVGYVVKAMNTTKQMKLELEAEITKQTHTCGQIYVTKEIHNVCFSSIRDAITRIEDKLDDLVRSRPGGTKNG